MRHISIRRAKASDARQVAVLLGGLGRDFRVTALRTARRLTKTTDTVFVAGAGREILGLIAVNTCHPVHSDHPCGRIMTIVVRPDRKREGVGRLLMRHALTHFRRLGCANVELTSRTYRGGAHRFYRAMGFTVTAKRFSRHLGG